MILFEISIEAPGKKYFPSSNIKLNYSEHILLFNCDKKFNVYSSLCFKHATTTEVFGIIIYKGMPIHNNNNNICKIISNNKTAVRYIRTFPYRQQKNLILS